MILRIALCLCCLLWASGAEAQRAKALKLLEKGKELSAARKVGEAKEQYLKAVEADPSCAEAHLALSQYYMMMERNGSKARHHLEQVEVHYPSEAQYAQVYLTLGQYALYDGNYERTLQEVKKFLSFTGVQKTSGQRALADKLLQTASYAVEGMKNPLPIQIQDLGPQVNVLREQYFPMLTADGSRLIFTARGARTDENLYECVRTSDGNWSAPQPMETLNTPANEGTCTISADGRTMVFTFCDQTADRPSMGSCDLFIARNVGGQWQQARNLGPAVNSRYWESQPALSADGRQLFFVSDRPGGQGQRDIYMSRQNEKGEWLPAVNLGPTVNTPLEDLSPFIHANGRTLYFSSSGHLGYGALDLFKTEFGDGGWEQPLNLGYPINNQVDQVALFITPEGNKAYFANEDIKDGQLAGSRLASFDLPEALRPSVAAGFVKGRILDKETSRPVPASVVLKDLQRQGEVVSAVTSDPQDGAYLFTLPQGSEYALHVNGEGYLFESRTFDMREQAAGGKEIDILLTPVKTGARVTLNNIFFETGSYALLDKSRAELQQVAEFLRHNPKLRVQIAGHTDDVGADEANMRLSVQRAEAVVAYLQQLGVPAAVLEAKGYGEKDPLQSNTSEEGRARNRRIEFRVK